MSPGAPHPVLLVLKRAFDLTGSLALLPVILPFTGLIALLVKLDSPGPAFYGDRRLGRSGRVFHCYKFRTMFLNNEEIQARYLRDHPEAQREWERFRKLRTHDPRVTRVGRFLRKWSLDEFPQVLNVLRGEMSLIGPRPYREDEVPLAGPNLLVILRFQPGVTGLWQVRGRNQVPFDERVDLEAWYVRNWSFWMDLGLLVRTVAVVVRRTGSY